ncbi:MAG: hypothetical protein ACP5NS_00675 [Candidatus Pacearchaeota archaeon]
MNLRGASTIGVILIILLSIVAIGVFLTITFKNIRNITASERAKCLGIDLKVTQCVVFPGGTVLPNSVYTLPYDGVYTVVERAYGGGEMRDIRFHLTYNTGRTELRETVNVSGPGFKIFSGDYSTFLEHSSGEFAFTPVTLTPSEFPTTLGVSAVVGKKDTLCEQVNAPLNCVLYVPSNFGT